MGRPWCRFACESDTKGENCLGESFCSGHPSQKKGRDKISVNEKPTLKLIETTEKNNREPARANCEDVWDRKEVRQEKKIEKKKQRERPEAGERSEVFFFALLLCTKVCFTTARKNREKRKQQGSGRTKKFRGKIS